MIKKVNKKKKSELMPQRIKKAKKKLVEVSHTHVRKRDSVSEDKIGGYCFDCGRYAEGAQFQCGHWIPDSSGGASLRYHPHNMHGQSGACNCGYNQEMVKINYSTNMVRKYGQERIDKLLQLKNKVIKADIIWYEKLIELYTVGNEQDIINFLEK